MTTTPLAFRSALIKLADHVQTDVLLPYRKADDGLAVLDAIGSDRWDMLSSGERTILRIVADLLNGSGGATFADLARLDSEAYMLVVDAMIAARG